MPAPAKRSNNNSLASYAALLRKVKETLILGHQKIEEQKVRTYWETGHHILTHTLHYKERADYGKQVLGRLADDLNTDVTVLRRCVQFREQYPQAPIRAGRREFTWSHFRELIAIPDAKTRLLLEKKASEHAWSAEELGAQAKRYRLAKSKEPIDVTPTVGAKPLTPIRGKLYHYQLVQRPTLGVGESADALLIDLGFGIFRDVGARHAVPLRDGDIVQSVPRDDNYRLTKIAATPKDLYTYTAFVERVLDGDTLKVRFDLGFNTWTRQTLRLRGLDCPEMDTKEGQAAKTFVQSYIKEAQQIVVRSSRSDKYDRYLADVFIPYEKDEIYLNNVLLEQSHAKRMD